MFLNNQQEDLLARMSVLRNGYYINSNGNEAVGKLFLLGWNECTLKEVNLKQAKNDNLYLEVTFTRKPCYVHGLKTKISFAPFTDYLFQDTLKDFCAMFGKDLKDPRPDEPFNAYMRRVYKGVNTFIGQTVKVAVTYQKELRKDDYGRAQMRNRFYDLQEKVYDWRMKMLYNIREDLDWSEIANNFV